MYFHTAAVFLQGFKRVSVLLHKCSMSVPICFRLTKVQFRKA
jgi:hypothetical protein